MDLVASISKWFVRVGVLLTILSLYFGLKAIEDAGGLEQLEQSELGLPVIGLFHGVFFLGLGWLLKKVFVSQKGKLSQLSGLQSSLEARKSAMYATSEAETVKSINVMSEDEFGKVMDELRRGKMINAIKLVRGFTGLGLKEAKDIVEHLKSSGTRDYKQEEVVDRPKPKVFNENRSVGQIVSEMDETVQDMIKSEINSGHTINAIKVTRKIYGCSLKKAKEIVLFLEKQ